MFDQVEREQIFPQLGTIFDPMPRPVAAFNDFPTLLTHQCFGRYPFSGTSCGNSYLIRGFTCSSGLHTSPQG